MKGNGKGKGQRKGGREGETRRDDPPPPRPGEEGGRPPRPQAAIEGILDENGDGKTGTVAGGPIFARFTDDALRYLSVRPEKGPSAVHR